MDALQKSDNYVEKEEWFKVNEAVPDTNPGGGIALKKAWKVGYGTNNGKEK